eukprot:5116012-Pleurochrysis_carterae.AAC.1
MYRVVLALGQREGGHVPAGADGEDGGEQRCAHRDARRPPKRLEVLEAAVVPREAKGAEHPEDPHEVVQLGAEVPLRARAGRAPSWGSQEGERGRGRGRTRELWGWGSQHV